MKEKLYSVIVDYFKEYSVEYNGIVEYTRTDCELVGNKEYCSHMLSIQYNNVMFNELYITGEYMTDSQFENLVKDELIRRKLYTHQSIVTNLLDPMYIPNSK